LIHRIKQFSFFKQSDLSIAIENIVKLIYFQEDNEEMQAVEMKDLLTYRELLNRDDGNMNFGDMLKGMENIDMDEIMKMLGGLGK
jgi:hypothetical protein